MVPSLFPVSFSRIYSSLLPFSVLALISLFPFSVAAKAIPGVNASLDSSGQTQKQDSIMAILSTAESRLKYQTGEVKLGEGLAVAKLPESFRYLDADQSAMVLSEMWGNPPGQKTLGMIFAPGQTPLKKESWAVIIQYDEDGYVKDNDAEKINYDDLLKDIQKSMRENNKERAKEGYEAINMVGWAERPYYDKASHKLHWAKELQFGESKETTLNYNIRVLGRKGVLILNAVSATSQLQTVKEGMKPILAAVEFGQDNGYGDFNPKMDKVATYGIAGLVAGGILAKVGFFKILIGLLIAAKKFIIIGLIAFVAYFRKLFKKPGEKKEIEDVRKQIPDEQKKI